MATKTNNIAGKQEVLWFWPTFSLWCGLTTGLCQHPSATQVEVPPPRNINYSCAENLLNLSPIQQPPARPPPRLSFLHPFLSLRSCQTAIRPSPKFTSVVNDECCFITYVTKQKTGDLNATRGNNEVNGWEVAQWPNIALPHDIFQQYVKLLSQTLLLSLSWTHHGNDG